MSEGNDANNNLGNEELMKQRGISEVVKKTRICLNILSKII